jgi:membrane-associated phospholipid phosphatase
MIVTFHPQGARLLKTAAHAVTPRGGTPWGGPSLGRRALLGWTAATIVSACERTATRQGEPSGGRFRTFLARLEAIEVPPPPPGGSAQERTEIAELIKLAQEGRSAETAAAARHWAAGAVVRWNEVARDLVASHRTEPPMASRVYALLSVAQYDALVSVFHHKYRHRRADPAKTASITPLLAGTAVDPSYPCAHAAISAASAGVLAHLYPAAAESLTLQSVLHQESRMRAGVSFRSDVTAGVHVGRAVGALVIAYAEADRATAVSSEPLPVGPGRWRCQVGEKPLALQWGQVRPWLMTSGHQFRAPPPPRFDSSAFRAALAEIRHFSDNRTAEQKRTAALWADGAGSYTPPGRWNKTACDLISIAGLNEIRAARVLALLNVATMDAGIACWDSKYHYGMLRPSQADPEITTPVALPNFPAYTSAHAVFSTAAATVLGHLFPARAESLAAAAQEASLSRLYGGIHYRFDAEGGAAQGRSVAALAIDRARGDGA